MFNKFYTTQMSASARMLKKRFTEIRRRRGRAARLAAAVMAAVMAAGALAATVALSAMGGNGLEYWDRDQYYLVSKAVIPFDVDLSAVPKWVREITDDGHIEAEIRLLDVRKQYIGCVWTDELAILKGDLSSVTARLRVNGYGDSFTPGEELDGRYSSFWICALHGYASEEKTFNINVLYDGQYEMNGAELWFNENILSDTSSVYTAPAEDEYSYCPASSMRCDDGFSEDYYDFNAHYDSLKSNYFADYEKDNYKNPEIDGIEVRITGIEEDALGLYVKNEFTEITDMIVNVTDLTDHTGLGGLYNAKIKLGDNYFTANYDNGGGLHEGKWMTNDLKHGHTYLVEVILTEYGDYRYRWKDVITME